MTRTSPTAPAAVQCVIIWSGFSRSCATESTICAPLFSHRLPLEDGVRGYELFANKLEGCTKVTLTP